MSSLTGSVPPPMRSPWSFMGSICLHTWVLAWVALGPSLPLERSKSLYEREIQPYEKHIVWYRLSERLPDVTPPEAKRDVRPLRAKAKFEQNIAAGPRDTDRPPQLIFTPAPEITPAAPLPLPNIVALAPRRPPALPFTAPPIKPRAPERAPTLPDAPKLTASTPVKGKFDEAAMFKPPVPDPPAPRIIPPFTPPPQPKLPMPSSDPPTLPAAPEVTSSAGDLTATVSLPRQHPRFVVRPNKAAAPAGPPTIAPPPPELSASTTTPLDASLVIAGLNPSKSAEVPAPPGSVKSGFSGGPKPDPKGGAGTPSGALLEIPSLTVQGGAKNPQPPVMVASVSPTSPEGIAAAMRSVRGATPPGGSPTRPAMRSSNAPDPRMYGRQVYTMAIQIPNLTSYSGSWLVWFASREAEKDDTAVDMRPPLPLHMVSARYIRTAEEERVQGKVRLWAVIGKDGHVGEISLMQHLDDRLDHSAEEALGKWLFQPAVRNGVAVDVDAVFEIPFTLAPLSRK
jgi:TonB family protein